MAISKTMDRAPLDTGFVAEEDRKVEWIVLSFLLDGYPDRRFTIPGASVVLNDGRVDLGGENAVERAIRELVGAGLLRCESGFVLPTRAAVHFWRLED